MLAVDTNVVVRLLTADEPRQAARARTLFAREEIFIAKTVLLETEWVLRSLYGFDADRVGSALIGLIGLSSVRCEDPVAVTRALQWFGSGLDLADALHVASSNEARQFATFDVRLAKRAKKQTRPEIVTI